jgi:hypothetical protein
MLNPSAASKWVPACAHSLNNLCNLQHTACHPPSRTAAIQPPNHAHLVLEQLDKALRLVGDLPRLEELVLGVLLGLGLVQRVDQRGGGP